MLFFNFKRNYFRKDASMVSATLMVALWTILVSRVVFSSPAAEVRGLLSEVALLNFAGAENKNGAESRKTASTQALSRALQEDTPPAQQEPARTTVITHHYTRIPQAFEAEDFTSWSQSRGALGNTFLHTASVDGKASKAAFPRSEFGKKTYTHELRSQSNQSRTIELVTTRPMFAFDNVGFPHIETSSRTDASRYKPFVALITLKTQPDGTVLGMANVACHGYSLEKTAARAARYESKIKQYAERYKVDTHLVKAVIAQESCFRKHAVSPAGAVGLMQLMPATAKWLGVKDKKNPSQNLRAGIRYLGQLKRQFDTDELALAAYNAGPGNVARYKGIPPFDETRKYVKKVMQNYHSYTAATRYNAELL